LSQQKRLTALDTLRGIAIFLVIAFHVSLGFPTTKTIAKVLTIGNIGVQLFFLISAITMCYMWNQRRGETFPIRKFYLRRGFRIAPAFWFAMIFYTAVKLFSPQGLGPIGPWDLLLTGLFLHSFSVHAINLVVPGGWSIGVEMAFYVIFPFLVLKIRSVNYRLLVSFLVYLGCVALTEGAKRLLVGDGVDMFLYYSMLTQLPVFLLGMALYSVVMAKEKVSWKVVVPVVLGWILVAFAGKKLGILSRPFFWIEVFLLGGGIALVILRGWSFKPFEFLGRLSYSVYLFHFAVLDLVVIPLSGRFFHGIPDYLFGLALTTALTSAVAWVSGKTLESWSTSWARKCIGLLDKKTHSPSVPVHNDKS